jgi:uncharacterized protein (TIGR03437 family)
LAQARPDWRRIGNAAVDAGLAGLASGPVERVWYSADARLLIRTASGRVFETADLDRWLPASAVPPAPIGRPLERSPEAAAIGKAPAGQSPRVYALGRSLYRSDDGGLNWENLTSFRGVSLVGDGLMDFAIHPANQDEVVVAGSAGVFRSADGGRSWSGLNQGLPNLAGMRLRALPSGSRGALLELAGTALVEWQPGERTAWRLRGSEETFPEPVLRQALSLELGGAVTAVAVAGEFVYAGMADGGIAVSPESGRGAWRRFSNPAAGAVTRFWVDAGEPRTAIAAFEAPGGAPGAAPVRLRWTLNGGAFWDDLSSDLPEATVYGVAADRASGAVYAATARGVFMLRTNLAALQPAGAWTRLTGLPEARAMDVQLDGGANHLWVVMEGFGVYTALAPHRIGDPRLVSAADLAARGAAPGSLMSVLGARVESARAGDLAVPVLAATDAESQIQIPYDARGETLAISVDAAGARHQFAPLRLGLAAPAIMVVDGMPLMLDADSGTLLDAMHPARSRTRVQILATGLGSVTPPWPAGIPAPLENPPRVAAPVRAWLDRAPVEVTRAELAPGYAGIYLVEIEVPAIVNYGPAELYLEAAGQTSNPVRVYVEP